MNVFIVAIPLFDSNMAVQAYQLCAHGEKVLGMDDDHVYTNEALSNPGLDIVEQIGIEAFADDKPLFLELSRLQLMAGVPIDSPLGPDRIVCVIPVSFISDREMTTKVHVLKEYGYIIAIDGYPEDPDAPMLEYASYIILDYTDPLFFQRYNGFYRTIRGTKPVISNIPSMEAYKQINYDEKALFSGSFYSQPITQARAILSPVKVNALHLLGQVNKEDFDLIDVVRIIERDPYCTISLLKFINTASSVAGRGRQKIESIRQAVAILGQKEVRQWATITLSVTLGEDKPGAITKLSLVRAKFAENIAGVFDLGMLQPSLFMTGLFSLLDVMLEKPLHTALDEIGVDRRIRSALVDNMGPYYPVMEMIYAYERADWDKTTQLMFQNDADISQISQAFLDALVWYNQLLTAIVSTKEDDYSTELIALQRKRQDEKFL